MPSDILTRPALVTQKTIPSRWRARADHGSDGQADAGGAGFSRARSATFSPAAVMADAIRSPVTGGAPAMGTILHAKEVPSAGGDTMFTNQCLACELLSPGMQRLCDGLRTVCCGDG